MLMEGAKALSHSKDSIDALNVFPVPDGDTGTNMDLTMQAACREMERNQSDDLSEVSSAISKGSLMGARGNSGVILSQIIRGFSKTFGNRQDFDAIIFGEALISGVNTAYKAVLKPVEGTILTVAKDGALEAQKYLKKNKNPSLEELLTSVIKSAEKSLDETPTKLKVLKDAGVVDAGGMGLVVIYKGFLNGLNKNLLKGYKGVIQGNNLAQPELSDFTKRKEEFFSNYKYCTELIVKGENLEEENLKKDLISLGDSLLVVGGENLIKIHIHTDRPGLVVDKCCIIGELSNVKIDNMKEQHGEFINREESEMVNNEKEDRTEKSPENESVISLIAVASGDGLKKIFESMGASRVISGGQSMNPSTQDILNAVEEVRGERVIILPNNKNVILSCKQVVDLTKKDVHVIGTTTIPQGLAALLDFNPYANDILEEKTKMEENLEDVTTAQVTYAVRESKINDIFVEEGDIIGLIEDTIVYSGDDIEEVAYQTLSTVIDDDKEVISIFSGDETNEKASNKLKARLFENFDELEIELYNGGQPLYYYIFSVE